MPEVRLYYVGGPCDARSTRVDSATLISGRVRCGGAAYVVQGQSPTLYRATWEVQAEAQAQQPPPLEGGQFDRAWHGLMEVLAFKVPAQLARQRDALRRIRAAVK